MIIFSQQTCLILSIISSKSVDDSIPFGAASSTSTGYFIFIHTQGLRPILCMYTCVYSFSIPESMLPDTAEFFPRGFVRTTVRDNVIDLKLLSISTNTNDCSSSSPSSNILCWQIGGSLEVLTAARREVIVLDKYCIGEWWNSCLWAWLN